jgi:hypothetical protein
LGLGRKVANSGKGGSARSRGKEPIGFLSGISAKICRLKSTAPWTRFGQRWASLCAAGAVGTHNLVAALCWRHKLSRACSPRGQRLVAPVPDGHWMTTTFVAALRHDEITASCPCSMGRSMERFLDLTKSRARGHDFVQKLCRGRQVEMIARVIRRFEIVPSGIIKIQCAVIGVTPAI